MVTGEDAEHIGTDLADKRWDATRVWAEKQLVEGEHIAVVAQLRGGWTSEIRGLDVRGPSGRRSLVLRSFVRPFFVRHAEGLLTREAAVLRLLHDTDIPAARLVAVDATAEYCDHPSLLMSRLPGTLRLGGGDADRRAELLARQLLRIHRLPVTVESRPRDYQAWTSPERVRPPEDTEQRGLWQRAVDVLRREPPQYRGCFLHRDFHPGNVLFTGVGDGLRISGVVDWVETSWGPADLDVAHCSTALALLHGVSTGMRFADRYVAAGGALADDPVDHLYWRLLDALAFAPDAQKVAVPWREVGRADLTPALLSQRLEGYMRALFDRYAC
ncbi:phosphotransferase family protein [Streptomyces sp. NPDC059688]|uniref:phosphotransferase family protein n=1 Tax=Streptomyces sp. NPDC059688 TaxID=3346906 RepID=UPI0036C70CA7